MIAVIPQAQRLHKYSLKRMLYHWAVVVCDKKAEGLFRYGNTDINYLTTTTYFKEIKCIKSFHVTIWFFLPTEAAWNPRRTCFQSGFPSRSRCAFQTRAIARAGKQMWNCRKGPFSWKYLSEPWSCTAYIRKLTWRLNSPQIRCYPSGRR